MRSFKRIISKFKNKLLHKIGILWALFYNSTEFMLVMF